MNCVNLKYNFDGKFMCINTMLNCIYTAKFYVYYLNHVKEAQ